MFQYLGKLISRTWLLWLIVWAALLSGLWYAAPPWEQVAQEGTFRFLPKDVPSLQAEKFLEEAFPQEKVDSSVAIVLSRPEKIQQADREFIEQTLIPELRELAEKYGGIANPSPTNQGQNNRNEPSPEEVEIPQENQGEDPEEQPLFIEIRSPRDRVIGRLLTSGDRKAMLVVIGLAPEFLSDEAEIIVNEIEELAGRLQKNEEIPQGLEVHLAGSAVLGRDRNQARRESAQAIERWTVWIVVGLLLIVFRAPLVSLIPLATLYFAVQVTLKILALLAEADIIDVFDGLEIYTTVLVYGAGVDYSLFLISRYQEELGGGLGAGEAIANAVWRVGVAVSASAGTEILGIAMLAFSEFGKFHQAGISIPLGLFVTFLAAMTLAPSLLRLLGRWTFWPSWFRTNNQTPDGRHKKWQGLWKWVASSVERRPGTIWLTTVALMVPFAALGAWKQNKLSYGLVDDLPRTATSVQGIEALEEYFSVGATAPVTMLIQSEDVEFTSPEGQRLIQNLTQRLTSPQQQDLKIADIRSVAQPLGTTKRAQEALRGEDGPTPLVRRVIRRRAIEYYVSKTERFGNQVTRLEILLNADPLTRKGIDQLEELRSSIRELLPEELEQAKIYFSGATASLRDLKKIAEQDRRSIQQRVTVVVLVVLWVLLLQVAIPIYLLISILFSYLVTFGVTYSLFWWINGAGFVGLDWAVPIFLFTLLVAVGADYNVLLITRIEEEQDKLGAVSGVTEGLERTGGIISSCGFIMAGTFATLAVGGAIAEMYQLGFALAFGMLLDTFAVRPLIVPTYLVLLNKGFFGRLGKWMGAQPPPEESSS